MNSMRKALKKLFDWAEKVDKKIDNSIIMQLLLTFFGLSLYFHICGEVFLECDYIMTFLDTAPVVATGFFAIGVLFVFNTLLYIISDSCWRCAHLITVRYIQPLFKK